MKGYRMQPDLLAAVPASCVSCKFCVLQEGSKYAFAILREAVLEQLTFLFCRFACWLHWPSLVEALPWSKKAQTALWKESRLQDNIKGLTTTFTLAHACHFAGQAAAFCNLAAELL